MRRLAGVVSVVAALVASGAAQADTPPSVWDRARDPKAAEEFTLHQTVQRRLIHTRIEGINEAERRRVLVMLQAAGAEKSRNPLLRFDLADTYMELKSFVRAAEVYEAAIKDFPDYSDIDDAWFRLAIACGHTGGHECEYRAYVETLRRLPDGVRRVTPLMNFAETEMHLGQLRDAIQDYREALRLAGIFSLQETAALTTWGLAVALDRAGEVAEAQEQARAALRLQHSIQRPHLLSDDNVFFVPEYEVLWYRGLGAAAAARTATSPRAALELWALAERFFADYVIAGTRTHDRWLPIAQARLATIKIEHAKADVRAAKEPPIVHEQGGVDLHL